MTAGNEAEEPLGIKVDAKIMMICTFEALSWEVLLKVVIGTPKSPPILLLLSLLFCLSTQG
jgi:hypothetical protein